MFFYLVEDLWDLFACCLLLVAFCNIVYSLYLMDDIMVLEQQYYTYLSLCVCMQKP